MSNGMNKTSNPNHLSIILFPFIPYAASFSPTTITSSNSNTIVTVFLFHPKNGLCVSDGQIGNNNMLYGLTQPSFCPTLSQDIFRSEFGMFVQFLVTFLFDFVFVVVDDDIKTFPVSLTLQHVPQSKRFHFEFFQFCGIFSNFGFPQCCGSLMVPSA